jgi:hypothetical protein
MGARHSGRRQAVRKSRVAAVRPGVRIALHVGLRTETLPHAAVNRYREAWPDFGREVLEGGSVVALLDVGVPTPFAPVRSDPFASGPWVWPIRRVIRLPRPVRVRGLLGVFLLSEEEENAIANQLGRDAVRPIWKGEP